MRVWRRTQRTMATVLLEDPPTPNGTPGESYMPVESVPEYVAQAHVDAGLAFLHRTDSRGQRIYRMSGADYD